MPLIDERPNKNRRRLQAWIVGMVMACVFSSCALNLAFLLGNYKKYIDFLKLVFPFWNDLFKYVSSNMDWGTIIWLIIFLLIFATIGFVFGKKVIEWVYKE